MGMYDELRCKYPLPVKGANDLLYQTKDTPSQFIDLYEIRADGTVWRQNYDIEDRSDPKAEGLERIIGCMTRINKRWEKVKDFNGGIRFYTCLGEQNTGWIEFSAHFVGGKLKSMDLVAHRPVDPKWEAEKAKEITRQLKKMFSKQPAKAPRKAKAARKARAAAK